jgi:hypothetical protein
MLANMPANRQILRPAEKERIVAEGLISSRPTHVCPVVVVGWLGREGRRGLKDVIVSCPTHDGTPSAEISEPVSEDNPLSFL